MSFIEFGLSIRLLGMEKVINNDEGKHALEKYASIFLEKADFQGAKQIGEDHGTMKVF